jgi:hypothetical protein
MHAKLTNQQVLNKLLSFSKKVKEILGFRSEMEDGSQHMNCLLLIDHRESDHLCQFFCPVTYFYSKTTLSIQ